MRYTFYFQGKHLKRKIPGNTTNMQKKRKLSDCPNLDVNFQGKMIKEELNLNIRRLYLELDMVLIKLYYLGFQDLM